MRTSTALLAATLAASAGTVFPIHWSDRDYGSAWLPFSGSESSIVGLWLPPELVRSRFEWWVDKGGVGCWFDGCFAQGFQWALPDNPHSAHVRYEADWNAFGGVHVATRIWAEVTPNWYPAPGAPADTVPPVTSATLAATPAPTSGWYESAGSVLLDGQDAGSGIPMEGTLFAWQDQLVYSPYADPLPVSAEGRYSLRYFSYDAAGNTEAEQILNFGVDLSPPAIDGLRPDRKYGEYFDFAANRWRFRVSGVVTDTLAHGTDFTFFQKELNNVAGCSANVPNSSGGFTMLCDVIDPQRWASVTFGWSDPAGHLVSENVATNLPEPAAWTLVLAGLALLTRVSSARITACHD